ncbi:MAG: hypothetical protein HY747_00800 [Elusimicrobia bacterium]|nr:hypothetical protein [Elusimicrobiota bacterium]
MKPLTFRQAAARDAAGLMRLYRKSAVSIGEDLHILDVKELTQSLASKDNLWILACRDRGCAAAVMLRLEAGHGLAKIERLYADPADKNSGRVFKAALRFLISYLEKNTAVDIIYCTTRTLTPSQLALTVELDFKMLGIFPGAFGSDESRINGLTAHFLRGVLKTRRHHRFALHPALKSLYEIVRRECGLEPLAAVAPADLDFSLNTNELPPMELLRAPLLIARRFDILRQKKSLSANFYPFQEPNALLTDPDQRLEVFLRIFDDMRFAVIIGERLDLPVNPVTLYRRIVTMLHNQGITYIEVINDAADFKGIDCILKASFIPCAYFPCLKKHEEIRRDYAVFAKSFEKRPWPSNLNRPLYGKFLKVYLKSPQNLPNNRPLKP